LQTLNSYDFRKVIIWAENNGRWQKSHEWSGHEASVHSVAFAPHEIGLLLATASADCNIGILEFNAQSAQWVDTKIIKAHDQGVNAVSWCPVQRIAGDGGDRPYQKKLVSCGNDNLVKIWVVDEKGEWTVEKTLKGHSDFVRDVAWCPVINHSTHTIASCGLVSLIYIRNLAFESYKLLVFLILPLQSLYFAVCVTFPHYNPFL
ncbi:WD domain, G-beta repeat protein, partial [Cooperia oncophora]